MAAKAERNARIRREAMRGRTYQEIADEFGISRQRVDQIMKPRRHNARRAATRAANGEKLARPDFCCICGARENIEMHHPDYDQPLLVVGMCVPCHRMIDRKRDRRVPKKQEPIKWTCETCGKAEMRKPRHARATRYCSPKCVGAAKSGDVDREGRFQEYAGRLTSYTERHGYIPGVTEFAEAATGQPKNQCVAVLTQWLDPSMIECGSYAGVMDRLYQTAGLTRPHYGRLPLTDIGPDEAARHASRTRSHKTREGWRERARNRHRNGGAA
jgi:hypothetical protein